MKYHKESVEAYTSKRVNFRYRGMDIGIRLSHGLFSSADIDSGTRLLLKVLSALLDNIREEGKKPPDLVLDAGCGTGIIGIAAAKALEQQHTAFYSDACIPEAGQTFSVRCQDRDELARQFTLCNAEENGIETSVLTAYTEPLLYGPGSWDLILSNIPAKAGNGVLQDFVQRSVHNLNKGGLAVCVVVKPLCSLFQSWITQAKGIIVSITEGSGHSVFVYGSAEDQQNIPVQNSGFLAPAYIRNMMQFSMEGSTYRMQTVHGCAGFDSPGNIISLAAKLCKKNDFGTRIDANSAALLVHGDAQGHFASWLCTSLNRQKTGRLHMVLSGRIVPGLIAAEHNVRQNTVPDYGDRIEIVPVIDPMEGYRRQAYTSAASDVEQGFDGLVFIPELVPRIERMEAHWQAACTLLKNGAQFIAGFSSAEAERFDRLKPQEFMRCGDIKRSGSRVLLYRKKNRD